MKVTGLDRIVIMVRDIDKAMELFSRKFGMRFMELDENIQKRDGNRGFVCHETHLHIVSPILPLPPTAPPPLRKGAEMIRDKDAMVLVLIFKVEDAGKAMGEMEEQGFAIVRTWPENEDYASVGMNHLVEFLMDPKDTLGLPICFSTWSR